MKKKTNGKQRSQNKNNNSGDRQLFKHEGKNAFSKKPNAKIKMKILGRVQC